MYLEGKKQIRDDVVGRIDQPMTSLKLQPNSLGIESNRSYLTNLCKTIPAAQDADRSPPVCLYQPQFRRLTRK